MRRFAMTVGMVGLLVLGTGAKLKKMSQAEQDHYYALRVFMDEGQEKAWFKLKTEEERNQYLKDQKLWDVFYQFDEETRAKILAGDVQQGWTVEQVYMSWGEPHRRQRLVDRPAQRSELLVYRFEVQEGGATLVWQPGSKTAYKAVSFFEQHVIVDDARVAEITQKDGWSD
jgi:hypothetical protein